MSLKRAALAILAALSLLSVTVFNPEHLSLYIERLIGWESIRETALTVRDPDVYHVVEQIDANDLRTHVEALTSFPSRVTGYPGAEAAAQYVEDQFRQIGLQDITSEHFEVPVPIDKGAHLRLPSGQRYVLHALWPNGVRTSTLPSDGITGHLIDAGRGTLSELDGQEIEGSIALMAFGSGNNYVEVRALGARAILFYDDGRVTRGEAAEKFLQVPVDIPRFWIGSEGAKALRKQAHGRRVQVHLEARMDWEQATARNIFAVLPGLDEEMPRGQRQQIQKWKDQILVVQAHYDAMSVVPALAPGAESAAASRRSWKRRVCSESTAPAIPCSFWPRPDIFRA